MTPPRHEYLRALGRPVPKGAVAGGGARHPTSDDAEWLAQLMLDAYRGTIDDEGETISDAREEVARYLAGRPLLEHSWLRLEDADAVAACLVAWSTRECPMVAYVMTASAWKGRGLASTLVELSLRSLAQAGHAEVRAWITEGNVPSETVLRRAGFRRV